MQATASYQLPGSTPDNKKPLVDGLTTKKTCPTRGSTCCSTAPVCPLSRRTLNLAARTIRTHRKKTGSRWRRLDSAQQALLVLVHLDKGETFNQVAAGFEVGTTTVWRYVRETTALLAEQAPTLEQGLCRAGRKGWGCVIVDGTLIACDRVAADRPFYSGKHKQHGMNVQVVAAPDGELLWASWSLLGSVHDRQGRPGVEEDRRAHQGCGPARTGRQGVCGVVGGGVLLVQGPG